MKARENTIYSAFKQMMLTQQGETLSRILEQFLGNTMAWKGMLDDLADLEQQYLSRTEMPNYTHLVLIVGKILHGAHQALSTQAAFNELNTLAQEQKTEKALDIAIALIDADLQEKLKEQRIAESYFATIAQLLETLLNQSLNKNQIKRIQALQARSLGLKPSTAVSSLEKKQSEIVKKKTKEEPTREEFNEKELREVEEDEVEEGMMVIRLTDEQQEKQKEEQKEDELKRLKKEEAEQVARIAAMEIERLIIMIEKHKSDPTLKDKLSKLFKKITQWEKIIADPQFSDINRVLELGSAVEKYGSLSITDTLILIHALVIAFREKDGLQLRKISLYFESKSVSCFAAELCLGILADKVKISEKPDHDLIFFTGFSLEKKRLEKVINSIYNKIESVELSQAKINHNFPSSFWKLMETTPGPTRTQRVQAMFADTRHWIAILHDPWFDMKMMNNAFNETVNNVDYNVILALGETLWARDISFLRGEFLKTFGNYFNEDVSNYRVNMCLALVKVALHKARNSKEKDDVWVHCLAVLNERLLKKHAQQLQSSSSLRPPAKKSDSFAEREKEKEHPTPLKKPSNSPATQFFDRYKKQKEEMKKRIENNPPKLIY